MKAQDSENRVYNRLQERRESRKTCPKHKLYCTLQQLSLLSRLFNKSITIKYFVEGKLIEIKTAAYLVTPTTLILKNGCMVNMDDIDTVKFS